MIKKMKRKLFGMDLYVMDSNHRCNIAFCQVKYYKNWKMFNLIKLLVDINVVKSIS